MGKIKDFLKENSFVITLIGGALFILNQTGFNINIIEFYKGLTSDGKIMFVFIVNTVITLVLFVFILNKINNPKFPNLEETKKKEIKKSKK